MRARAFSLLELLVVVGVLAVLMAVLLPALRGARQAGLIIGCVSNVRSCAQAMTVYATDYRGAYPVFGRLTYNNSFTNGPQSLNYYLQSIHWPMVMRDYLSDQFTEPVQFCPGGEQYREAFGAGSYADWIARFPEDYCPSAEYRLGYGFLSDPRVWRAGGNAADSRLLRSARIDEVRFPSHKGLLVETVASHLGFTDTYEASIFAVRGRDKAYSTSFVDAHAGTVAYGDFLPFVRPTSIAVSAPVVSTRDGVLGRDVATVPR